MTLDAVDGVVALLLGGGGAGGGGAGGGGEEEIKEEVEDGMVATVSGSMDMRQTERMAGRSDLGALVLGRWLVMGWFWLLVFPYIEVQDQVETGRPHFWPYFLN